MILRVLHFFIGHKWSEWVYKVCYEGFYDEERWRERYCSCGLVQIEDLPIEE